MTEEISSTIKYEQSNFPTVEKQVVNHFKKTEVHKESLYREPVLKCYIGAGNNSEL